MSEEAESAENAGWFHCGKCGALFGAEMGAGVPEVCPVCGMDPVVSHSEVVFAQAAGEAESPQKSSSGFNNERSQRSSKRSPGDGKGWLIPFVVIWVLVLVVLAVAVKFFQGSGDLTEGAIDFGNQESKLLAENLHLLKDEVEQYFAEGIPERRTEFVLNPGETLRRMVGFEQANQFVSAEEEPERLIAGVIETPRGKGIETVWKIGTSRKVEALFLRDGEGEWKMDWANMVRYSEKNWPLYLGGEGEDLAEFRLLARRRSGDLSGNVSSVVLLGPRMDHPGEVGASSPEVVVEPDSRVGRALTAAFRKREAGEGVYGSEAFTLDPRGMIRVRLRLLREGESEKSFLIREVVACHWYDFDDLGLED